MAISDYIYSFSADAFNEPQVGDRVVYKRCSYRDAVTGNVVAVSPVSVLVRATGTLPAGEGPGKANVVGFYDYKMRWVAPRKGVEA